MSSFFDNSFISTLYWLQKSCSLLRIAMSSFPLECKMTLNPFLYKVLHKNMAKLWYFNQFFLSLSIFYFSNFAENQEKFFLYLFISVTVGVLLCLTLVIGRLVLQKRQVKSDKKSSPKNQSQNGNNGETTIPNGFSDDISEIDGDIDMTTTTLPVPSVSRNEVSQTPFILPSVNSFFPSQILRSIFNNFSYSARCKRATRCY